LEEGLSQGVSGRGAPQGAYARDLPRLLPLCGERPGEERRTSASEEGATVYQWVPSQAVRESGARGCGALGNRAGSMQKPSSLAGRESSRVSAPRISLRRGVPTTANAAQGERRRQSGSPRIRLGGLGQYRATNYPQNPKAGLFLLEGIRTSMRLGLLPRRGM